MKSKREKRMNVIEIIQEVVEEMCDKYCKYREKSWEDENTLAAVCENCPLNKLN